jgi:hypothetical protein
VVIGRNRFGLWVKPPIGLHRNRIFVEINDYSSYANRILKTTLQQFYNLDQIDRGRRKAVEVPDDVFKTALELSTTITKYELSALPKFREEFNRIESSAKAVDEYLNKMKELVSRYVTVRVLRSL